MTTIHFIRHGETDWNAAGKLQGRKNSELTQTGKDQAKERAERLDRYTINIVLARFQDEADELKKGLWLIINNPKSTDQSKISAIRELRNTSKDLLDKMFDAGIFRRKLGEGDINLTEIFRAIKSKE